MTDALAPETALLDLDWLIDQASLFIAANAIDCELESRIEEYTKVSGCPAPMSSRGFSSPVTGLYRPAPAALGDALRREIKNYLAHLSVEEIYDPYLDHMAKLELRCRKEEVSRKLDRWIEGSFLQTGKKAA